MRTREPLPEERNPPLATVAFSVYDFPQAPATGTVGLDFPLISPAGLDVHRVQRFRGRIAAENTDRCWVIGYSSIQVTAATATETRSDSMFANSAVTLPNGTRMVATGWGSVVLHRRQAALQSQGTSYIFPVAFAAPQDQLSDLDAFYREEHVDLLFANQSWLATTVLAVEGAQKVSWSRLVIHEIASPAELTSAEVQVAASTEWRQRLAKHQWYPLDRDTFHRID